MLIISETKKQALNGEIKKYKAKKDLEIAEIHRENIKMAYKEGVKILMGTDSGVFDHGKNLIELSLLCEIGMSPLEAIAAGTIEAAKAMEIDHEVGSLEVGKSADIIMTDKNPLENISYLSDPNNILVVIQDGEIVKDIR